MEGAFNPKKRMACCFFSTPRLTLDKLGNNFVSMQDSPKQQPRKVPNRSRDRTMNSLVPNLSHLAILQALPIGVVAFDKSLKILVANPEAGKLIQLGDHIDASLTRGTDEKIWQGWTEPLRSAISSGENAVFDEVDCTSKGKTRLLRIVCSPLTEPATGEILGGTITIEDVTEKVNTDRKLANAEKLAAIGKHASKVAHELNNPLDGILRYINLAMRIIEQENLEKPIEYLTQCRRGLMRMVQILGELLEFSRSARAPMEYAKVEQVIDEALKTMEARAEALGVTIVRDYGPGLPQIRSGDLFQVFCNLAKNALDAMENGGRLDVSARIGEDNTVIVEFRDTGVGLPPGNIEAIFEPFFTTKADRKGTGLGLAICRDIVESHSGRITAENAPEGGSIFTVYLPVGKQVAKGSNTV
jgi:signal transduction histidine kinase